MHARLVPLRLMVADFAGGQAMMDGGYDYRSRMFWI